MRSDSPESYVFGDFVTAINTLGSFLINRLITKSGDANRRKRAPADGAFTESFEVIVCTPDGEVANWINGTFDLNFNVTIDLDSLVDEFRDSAGNTDGKVTFVNGRAVIYIDFLAGTYDEATMIMLDSDELTFMGEGIGKVSLQPLFTI